MNPPTAPGWAGTITIQDGEQAEIRAMGITILGQAHEATHVDLFVRLDDEAMTKLEPLWGRFIWFLTPEKGEVEA